MGSIFIGLLLRKFHVPNTYRVRDPCGAVTLYALPCPLPGNTGRTGFGLNLSVTSLHGSSVKIAVQILPAPQARPRPAEKQKGTGGLAGPLMHVT
jgi:hypothetical protein